MATVGALANAYRWWAGTGAQERYEALTAAIESDEWGPHVDCDALTACRAPLHPGPCKGWKHTLHLVAPGAWKTLEKERVDRLNQRRLAKVAELKSQGLRVPPALLKDILPRDHPGPAPSGWTPGHLAPGQPAAEARANVDRIANKVGQKAAAAKGAAHKAAEAGTAPSRIPHQPGPANAPDVKVPAAPSAPAAPGREVHGVAVGTSPHYNAQQRLVANIARGRGPLGDGHLRYLDKIDDSSYKGLDDSHKVDLHGRLRATVGPSRAHAQRLADRFDKIDGKGGPLVPHVETHPDVMKEIDNHSLILSKRTKGLRLPADTHIPVDATGMRLGGVDEHGNVTDSAGRHVGKLVTDGRYGQTGPGGDKDGWVHAQLSNGHLAAVWAGKPGQKPAEPAKVSAPGKLGDAAAAARLAHSKQLPADRRVNAYTALSKPAFDALPAKDKQAILADLDQVSRAKGDPHLAERAAAVHTQLRTGVAPAGTPKPAAVKLAPGEPAGVKHVTVPGQRTSIAAQHAVKMANGGTAKAKLAAYQGLSKAEYEALPAETRTKIARDLALMHGKFLDPAKKKAVTDTIAKLGSDAHVNGVPGQVGVHSGHTPAPEVHMPVPAQALASPAQHAPELHEPAKADDMAGLSDFQKKLANAYKDPADRARAVKIMQEKNAERDAKARADAVDVSPIAALDVPRADQNADEQRAALEKLAATQDGGHLSSVSVWKRPDGTTYLDAGLFHKEDGAGQRVLHFHGNTGKITTSNGETISPEVLPYYLHEYNRRDRFQRNPSDVHAAAKARLKAVQQAAANPGPPRGNKEADAAFDERLKGEVRKILAANDPDKRVQEAKREERKATGLPTDARIAAMPADQRKAAEEVLRQRGLLAQAEHSRANTRAQLDALKQALASATDITPEHRAKWEAKGKAIEEKFHAVDPERAHQDALLKARADYHHIATKHERNAALTDAHSIVKAINKGDIEPGGPNDTLAARRARQAAYSRADLSSLPNDVKDVIAGDLAHDSSLMGRALAKRLGPIVTRPTANPDVIVREVPNGAGSMFTVEHNGQVLHSHAGLGHARPNLKAEAVRHAEQAAAHLAAGRLADGRDPAEVARRDAEAAARVKKLEQLGGEIRVAGEQLHQALGRAARNVVQANSPKGKARGILSRMIDAPDHASAAELAAQIKGPQLDLALSGIPANYRSHLVKSSKADDKRKALIRWATSADQLNGDAIRRGAGGGGSNHVETERAARRAELAKGALAPSAEASPARSRSDALRSSLNTGVKNKDQLTGGAVGDTYVVTTNDGTKAVVKDAKQVDWLGEMGSPVRQQDAEELASILLERMGVKAPALVRQSPSRIAMEFVPGVTGSKLGNADMLKAQQSRQGKLIDLFDQVVNNTDRHAGNWMFSNGQPIPIDHGLSFGYERPDEPMRGRAGFGTPFNHFGGWAELPYSPADMAKLKGIVQGMGPEFERMGHADWQAKALQRIAAMTPHAKGTTNLL